MESDRTMHPKAQEDRHWRWKHTIIVFGSGPENGPTIDALMEAENAAREALGGDRSIGRLAFDEERYPEPVIDDSDAR